MTFDLRNHLEWTPASANPLVRRLIKDWTGREPTPSMHCALPADGHDWLWKLMGVFAPHSTPIPEVCADIRWFQAKNEASHGGAHVKWLAEVRPAGADVAILLLRDTLVSMPWDEYIWRFAPQISESAIWTPDFAWVSLQYFDEHSVCFRPRWDAVRAIARIASVRIPDGRIVSNDRIAIRFEGGQVWESERLGHKIAAGTMLKMAGVVSAVCGVPIEEHELNPWDTWDTSHGGKPFQSPDAPPT